MSRFYAVTFTSRTGVLVEPVTLAEESTYRIHRNGTNARYCVDAADAAEARRIVCDYAAAADAGEAESRFAVEWRGAPLRNVPVISRREA